MMLPAGDLAFSLHRENRSHHTLSNRWNSLHCPRPLLPPSCGRGIESPKARPSAWAQAPTPLAFPRTLFSSCLLPTTINFSALQNYGSGDRNYPLGLTPPSIYRPIFFWFLFTTQLLGKCLHQLFSLPYLLFALQPIPTWRPLRQLNLNGFCQVTRTLPAANTSEHISVFTSLSLSEASNSVGRGPLQETPCSLGLRENIPLVSLPSR